MSKWPSFFVLILVLFATTWFLGAASSQQGNSIRTISTGWHVPYTDEIWDKIQKKEAEPSKRFVVWGNHNGAVQAAVELLQEKGHTVIERLRLQEIFDEQQIRITHTSEDDSRILKVGQLLKADQVVFIDASVKNEAVQVSVVARSVPNSEVRWKGHSTLTQAVTNPEFAVPLLTIAAMLRAICPVERGMVWIEFAASEPGREWGCPAKE